MARGDVRIAVTLACEECKRRNYQTNKSKRNNPDRISLRKYCKWCRQSHRAPRDTLGNRFGPRPTAREAAPASPVGRHRAVPGLPGRVRGILRSRSPTDTVFPTRGAVGPVDGDDVDVDETIDLVEAEEEAVEAAPDQLDPAVTEERDQERHPRRSRGRVFTFLGHVIDELRRVMWPDRRHVGQGTAVVLGFVVIAGSYLGLLDAIWKPLIEAIL